jgi:CBS domain-containing membrane protein
MSTVALREQWRAASGAAVGVFLAGLLCHLAALRFGWSPWLVAPIGASAVLVFALPASPLAQPWPVIAGNTLSACVGVAVGLLLPDPVWAGAVAVGLAILAMFLLRCLHPPGGAVALLAVLTQAASPRWPFFPVMADSLLLVLAGAAWNTLTGRSYPHRPAAAAQPVTSRFTQADIDAAVSRYGQVLDLGRDDLAGLLESAEAHAYGRRLGSLRCVDVMSPDPVVADYAMPLEEAWRLLRERRIKALPVVDRGRRLVGIVTVADFMRQANLDVREGLAQRLWHVLRPARGLHADGPDVVGNIMSREVCSVVDERPVADLLPLFAERGHHHIPVVDAALRIQGIVTPTDLMRAVLRAELS